MTTQEYDVDTINKLYADREALVMALKYYSREYNYAKREHTFALNGPHGGRGCSFVEPVMKDGGKRARKALKRAIGG